MLTKIIVPAVALFSLVFAGPIGLAGQSSSSSVKTEVERRLQKGKFKVVVKMVTGSKLSGRLVSAGDDSFVLREEETGRSQTIPYVDVKQVRGRGLGKTAKAGIIVGVAVGVTVLVLYIAFQNAIRDN